MAILCQELVLGARSIIRIEFDVPNSLLMTRMEVLFFVELHSVSPPHVAIVLCLNVLCTVPVIKDIPDDSEVILLGDVVFDLLILAQSQLIPVALFEFRQLSLEY